MSQVSQKTAGQVQWRATVRYRKPFDGGTAYGTAMFTVTAGPDIFTAHQEGMRQFLRDNSGAQPTNAMYTRVDEPASVSPANDAQPSLWDEGGAE